jgi:hypothetical protein
MRLSPMTLCRFVVALGAAGFIGGWAGCVMIQGESVTTPDRIHDRPLKIKGSLGPPAVHYITARQEMMFDLMTSGLTVSWIVALAGGIGLYILTDAEREAERLQERRAESLLPSDWDQ